jgi:hypothetical protein
MPSFYVSKEDIVDSLVEQLTVQEMFDVVEGLLDGFALAEIDEELIARIWNKLKGVYQEGETLPTLDGLVEQYIREE